MTISTSKTRESILQSSKLFDLLGLIFMIVFVLTVPPLSSDPGVGWHLKTGEWILENRAVPDNDPFLWSREGRSWVANQWLADILLWTIFKFGGWDALAIFCFALPLIVMLWLQGTVITNNNFSTGSNANHFLQSFLSLRPFAVIALGILVAWVQWIVRPVVFSFVFFSIVFFLIWKFYNCRSEKNDKSLIFYIPLIFLMWCNLHSAFPLGLLLLFCALIAAAVSRRTADIRTIALSLVLSTLVTFINPYGYRLHVNIAGLLSSHYFMKLNNEWLSPQFSESIFLPLTFVIALLILRAGSGRTTSLWLRIVTAVFSVLALRAVRYTPFLGLIVPAILADQERAGRRENNFLQIKYFVPAGTLFLSVSLFIAALIWDLDPGSRYSSKILRNDLMWQQIGEVCSKAGGRIYNHPDLGGAITFKLYPDCKASIDDRNELNGVRAYEDFFRYSRADSVADFSELPSAMIIECSSGLAILAKHGHMSLRLSAEFDRFCLVERG